MTYTWFGRMLGHRKGSIAVYVALITPVLIGIGALSIDLGRLMSLNTELQSAADAASLACARELDRATGAIDRCRNAAVQAVQNLETFGANEDGLDAFDLISSTPCDDTTPVPPCIRILKDLPANDTDPITAANVTTVDADARFGEVFTRVRQVNNILIRLATFGAAPAFSSTDAHAVAGQNQVICNVPPMWMCNPTEPTANTNLKLGVELDLLETRSMALFLQQGSQTIPGNFGLLCPAGAEDGGNCGGKSVKEALASTQGTCVTLAETETKTGATLGPVRAGINARFDYWEPQAKTVGLGNWRDLDLFQPAANVTQGGTPPAIPGGGAKCEYKDDISADATNPKTGYGLGRDACILAGTCNVTVPTQDGSTVNLGPRFGDSVPGNPTWAYTQYYRINHGCDPATTVTDCKPGDWDSLTGDNSAFAPAPWPPSRYDTYRYELESTSGPGGNSVVQPLRNIAPCPAGTMGCDSGGEAATITAEDGKAQCFTGTPPVIPGYKYFESGKKRNLALLGDRRVFPIAIANCNALAGGGNLGGKFAFSPAEYVFIFLTEPMDEPGGPTEMHTEMLGKLDEGTMKILVRDVVQLYRRK